MSGALRSSHSSIPALSGFVRFFRARLIGWGFIALLLIVAFLSARLALSTQYKMPRTAAMSGQKHAPDFSAKQFTLWRSSLDGATQYQFSGDSITHFRDDLSSIVVKPLMIAKTKSANTADLTTTITADHALIRNDGEIVQFTNTVSVTRKTPTAALSSLQSDSLVLAPDINLIITKSPVIVTHGRNQSLAQGGISYSHTDAVLQLTGGVRTIIASN
jgi:lipopolysaccharide export system protein LptC